jgi:hypothetical protein
MPEPSVLHSLTPDSLNAAPYAHVVRAPALPEAAYRRLAVEFPGPETILGGRKDAVANAAARLPAMKVLDNPEISAGWRDFFAYHSSAAFWQDIVRVFGPALRSAFPGIEDRAGRPLEDWRAGPRGLGDDGEIRLDCQFVINTPARRPSSVKTQHVDKRTTILSMLLYFRDPEDRSEGGDLEVYAWKRDPRFLPFQRMILPKDLELKRVVKYAPNTLVCFVNSAQAPHGVSPRRNAELPRRYINFICETPFKAFATPEIGLAERIIHWPQIRKLGLRSVGGDRY